jgi:hypothetical protein
MASDLRSTVSVTELPETWTMDSMFPMPYSRRPARRGSRPPTNFQPSIVHSGLPSVRRSDRRPWPSIPYRLTSVTGQRRSRNTLQPSTSNPQLSTFNLQPPTTSIQPSPSTFSPQSPASGRTRALRSCQRLGLWVPRPPSPTHVRRPATPAPLASGARVTKKPSIFILQP